MVFYLLAATVDPGYHIVKSEADKERYTLEGRKKVYKNDHHFNNLIEWTIEPTPDHLKPREELCAPKVLLPKSALLTPLESKLSKYEEINSIATKIKLPPKTSDNCRFELSHLLIYAPI